MDWITDAIRDQLTELINYENFENTIDFAKGGSAQIRCADWGSLDRKVILKKLINYDIQKFVQEVKMHIKCHVSEYVVKFLGLTEEIPNINEYTMVMAYADHKSLRNFLRSRHINWDTKYKLSIHIAQGLDCIHSNQIIHRDLHTDNIVINQTQKRTDQPEFIAKITDFGEAISTKERSVDIDCGFGQPEFTDPNYLDCMSCITRKRNEKSDIYSLGVIFWEISSNGKIPFENFMRDFQNRLVFLSLAIINGEREKVPPLTPNTYSLLYTTCWHIDQTKRPTLEKTIKVLSKIDNISVSDVENILNLKDDENIDDKLDDGLDELDIQNYL